MRLGASRTANPHMWGGSLRVNKKESADLETAGGFTTPTRTTTTNTRKDRGRRRRRRRRRGRREDGDDDDGDDARARAHAFVENPCCETLGFCRIETGQPGAEKQNGQLAIKREQLLKQQAGAVPSVSGMHLNSSLVEARNELSTPGWRGAPLGLQTA
ncbi:unnamed protein product [Prorocentrum cordatum]|uniref:Uncharacterized protein n=1 Tax=Prorocentrum cordatum TaxID=2364126 RepID=A0ABN9YGQ0_9DINO|nr:unnamed protein product [Polarella glacialis]